MTSFALLRRDTRGGVGIIAAFAMPMLIGAAALAVDVGSVQLDTRRLQGIADAAALAAAADPASPRAAADAIVAASNFPRAISMRLTSGTYRGDPTVAPAARFDAAGQTPDAARIELESTSPTFLAAIFGRSSVSIARTATARRQRFAAFSIGSRLARLDGGILNAYLGALTGSNVSLSVMDYRALAGADVDLFAMLPQLRTRASLRAATFDDVLKSQITAAQALDALASTLDADRQAGAAASIRQLANVSGGRSIALATLLDAGPLAQLTGGATGIAKVDALALATAVLQIASPSRQVSLDLGASLPGAASTRLFLAIGDREQQSPWITISANGSPIVRTAQMRMYVRSRLTPIALPGLNGAVAIDLPVVIELAGAEGRMSSIDCGASNARGVTLEARTDMGSAAIGAVDETRLDDFGTPLTPAAARLVTLPLVTITGSSRVSLGAAEAWQALRFDDAMIAGGGRRTVRSSTPIGGVATSLAGQATLGANVLGLPIAVDPLLRAVGVALQSVAPALDTLIVAATGTLGVGIGEADLRVTGMRCGAVTLVG